MFKSQKGASVIVVTIIVVVAILIAVGLIYYFTTLKSILTPSSKAEYQNPFNESAEYQNPFNEYQNPFENLQ